MIWPFTRRKRVAPQYVTKEGVRLTYDMGQNLWCFEHQGVSYWFFGATFHESLLQAPAEILPIIERHQREIREVIVKHLGGSYEDRRSEEIVSIDLTDYRDRQQFDVGYAAENWGDLGINVIFERERIVDDWSGD